MFKRQVALELSVIIVGNPVAQILGNLQFASLGKIWNFSICPTNFLLLSRLSVSILCSVFNHVHGSFANLLKKKIKFIRKKMIQLPQDWFGIKT